MAAMNPTKDACRIAGARTAVNFDKLVQSVVNDTVGPGGSLAAFRPELALCGTIVAMLLAEDRRCRAGSRARST